MEGQAEAAALDGSGEAVRRRARVFMKTLDYVVRCRLVASHRQVADAGKALRPRFLRPESSIDNLPRLQLTVAAGAQSSELSIAAEGGCPLCARG